MRLNNFQFLIFLTIISLSCSLAGQTKTERQWPGYRGYMSSGILDNAKLPESFDPSAMKNIKWKIEIPGLGTSSPVIWDNFLFLTTAVSKSDSAGFNPGSQIGVVSVNDSSVHQWKVLCLDKNTGKLIWEKTAHTGIPAMKRHPKSSHANESVATDGKYVIAFFGSEGLYCYDMKGNLQWQKNFGVLKSVFVTMKSAQWEFASSPVLYNGVVVIQVDVLENSFIAAFDAKTGKELWKTTRDDYPGWSTPNIYKQSGKTYIAVNGYKHIGGYDFENGKEVWKMSGGGDIPIPTPVIGENMIYINGSHGKSSPVFAISSLAKGDISLAEQTSSNEFVKWSKPRLGSYIQSLLLYRNHLYNIQWNGTVTCMDPITGNELFTGKLGKARSFYSSPVASDGKIYITDEQGTVYIFQDGSEFKLLAEISLNDPSMTAAAITDGAIYFRTQHFLIAIGNK
jgi:outer membrane protein assembly factor BamB